MLLVFFFNKKTSVCLGYAQHKDTIINMFLVVYTMRVSYIYNLNKSIQEGFLSV